MKIYIVADGEGISGVVNSEEMHHSGKYFDQFRKLMTMDVNAAIEGAFEAGATEVVVNDAHWSMLNILYEELDPRAELIRGSNKNLCMMEQVEGFDAALFIGLHAKVGHSHGVANETMVGPEMYETRLNGVSVGELELNAAIAGHFGVPVIMVSGDDCLASEAKHCLGDIETAIVKKSIDRWAARCLPMVKAHEEIRTKSFNAVKRINDFKPYQVMGPVEMEIEWTSTAECKKASLVPGSYLKSPRIIAYKGRTFLEAWKGIFACLHIGSTAFDNIYG
ncbi:M55 family metallopeptidase [Bacillus sp. FJAT-49705]|uniref:M55 family metallopeptidase n=1 Tax=Cytobacillus citreus TaxID=2833586 RepID=A0ABS5NYL4_9BACI|nr:M55 family metallopeptidase [Cytobacillus citreus]MBS4192941.1 M55 family metallopeptidase [Cytobacillus citreus]